MVLDKLSKPIWHFKRYQSGEGCKKMIRCSMKGHKVKKMQHHSKITKNRILFQNTKTYLDNKKKNLFYSNIKGAAGISDQTDYSRHVATISPTLHVSKLWG